MIVHKYATFIKFTAVVHNIILDPTRDVDKQVHDDGFMVTDEDVDAIIHLWPEEWRDPLGEPLPKGQEEEDPIVQQVHVEGNEGGDEKGNQQMMRKNKMVMIGITQIKVIHSTHQVHSMCRPRYKQENKKASKIARRKNTTKCQT